MKLKIKRIPFLENLIGPASKLAENICLEFSDNRLIKTIVTSSDNSTILLASIPCEVEEPFKCIIPDCKTFLRLFSGIADDAIVLQIDSNAIEYKNSTMSFKYHLLDETYMVNRKSISEEKLNSLSFDTTFELSKRSVSEIFRFNSIIPEAEKLYFLTKGGSVIAKLGDEQKANTNELTTVVSNNFEGSELSNGLPINIQNILLMSFADETIKVKINHQLKVFKFETPLTSYVVSGLVK